MVRSFFLLLACTKLKNRKKVLSRFHSVSLGLLGHMNEIMMMMMIYKIIIIILIKMLMMMTMTMTMMLFFAFYLYVFPL